MKKSIFVSALVLSLVLAGTSFAHAAESKVLLISSHADATVKTNSTQNITWSTENFPADGLININLIEKTSGSPAEYKLVRSLHTNIANTGSASWTPTRKEVGDDLMIEIGCSSATEFPNGCVSGTDTETFAVQGGFSASLASAFDSFIAFIKGIFGK